MFLSPRNKLLTSFLWLPLALFSKDLPYDLEAASQDFVLETKKIEIPGFPHAFNPGLIRWQGRILMSFRTIPERKNAFNSEIGLVFLDEDFIPISEPQLLSLRDERDQVPCRAEDGRLVLIDGHLFLVYDDNVETKVSKGGFRVFISEIDYDGTYFIAKRPECLRHFENENRNIREKGWVPFEYRQNLLLAYSISPHRIFYPLLDRSGICETVSETDTPVSWEWGILRGGTPALLEQEGYLAFFHSSIDIPSLYSEGNEIAHYFIGAYLFSSAPPFQLLQISPSPIIGKNFYNGPQYKPYWKPIRCVFPCGYISDKNFIWISYGRDDHEAWIAKLDKKKLLESLIDIPR